MSRWGCCCNEHAIKARGATLHVGDTPDSDSDGINDTWESSYLESLSASSASLDSDGNGVSDHFEYLHGSIPTDASSKGFQSTAGPDVASGSVRFAWTVAEGMVLGQDHAVCFHRPRLLDQLAHRELLAHRNAGGRETLDAA